MPSIWYWKAFLIALLAFTMFPGLLTAQRSMYRVPGSWPRISLKWIGCPSRRADRPGGVVVETCPRRVVGAIWPPVMP